MIFRLGRERYGPVAPLLPDRPVIFHKNLYSRPSGCEYGVKNRFPKFPAGR